MERRSKCSGLDERPSLVEIHWRFNPKLPRSACFELHTQKFIREDANALIIGKPGTGKSHVARAVACQATLQGCDAHYGRLTPISPATGWPVHKSSPNSSRHGLSQTCCCWTTCSLPGVSPTSAPSSCRPSFTNATNCAAPSSSHPTAWCETGEMPGRRHPGHHHP